MARQGYGRPRPLGRQRMKSLEEDAIEIGPTKRLLVVSPVTYSSFRQQPVNFAFHCLLYDTGLRVPYSFWRASCSHSHVTSIETVSPQRVDWRPLQAFMLSTN